MDSFAVLVDRRCHYHLDDLNHVVDHLRRHAGVCHLGHETSHREIVDG